MTSRPTFSIQSVSKPFVFALVCEAIGYEAARHRLGVNSTGFPFNSLMAVELNDAPDHEPVGQRGCHRDDEPGSRRHGRGEVGEDPRRAVALRRPRAHLSQEVYESESASNLRNQGIAHLLQSYERLYFDPDEATDVYTRQCSLDVTVHDLAVMAATLANGGVNPMTGERVIVPGVCRRVLAVMATAGLYELSGDWLYEIGVPGKSGVSGGIVTMSPGKGGLGDLLAAPGRCREQRARPTRHQVPGRAARAQPVRVRTSGRPDRVPLAEDGRPSRWPC